MGVNSYSCKQMGANTGVGDCSLVLGKIAGFFLVPKSFEIQDNKFNDVDLFELLNNSANSAIFSTRIFPVHDIIDVADNSAEPAKQNFGYGPQITVNEGTYQWTFTLGTGGICLLKNLKKFNGSSTAVIFYDENGVLIGHKVGSSLKGVPVIEFFANNWKLATGTEVMGSTVSFTINPKYLNIGLGFYKLQDETYRYEDVTGLQNVNLKVVSHTAGTAIFDIKATAGCDGEDLFTEFQTTLADTALWKAKSATTGNAITVTSVAANQNSSAWTVTLDSADADMPVAGGFVLINLTDPMSLSLAGVVGFEGIEVKNVR